jgi:hypothetical protein
LIARSRVFADTDETCCAGMTSKCCAVLKPTSAEFSVAWERRNRMSIPSGMNPKMKLAASGRGMGSTKAVEKCTSRIVRNDLLTHSACSFDLLRRWNHLPHSVFAYASCVLHLLYPCLTSFLRRRWARHATYHRTPSRIFGLSGPSRGTSSGHTISNGSGHRDTYPPGTATLGSFGRTGNRKAWR